MHRKQSTEPNQELKQEPIKQKQRNIEPSRWELSKEAIERLLGTKLKPCSPSIKSQTELSSPLQISGRRSFKRFNPLIEDVSYPPPLPFKFLWNYVFLPLIERYLCPWEMIF